MKPKGKLKWRHSLSTGYHYYEDGQYGWGHCFKTVRGEWGASWDGGFITSETLKGAKLIVEQGVRKLFQKIKPIKPKKL